MAIRFACRCGKKLKAPDEKIGKRVLCPACGNPVAVPEENTIAVEEISNSAADLAGDLLRRSAETKKSRPYAEDEGELLGFDVFETVKALTIYGLLPIVGVIVFSYVLYLGSSWVMTTERDLPELGQVTGTVTLDGKPVIGATVTFQPIKAERPEGKKISASLGRTDNSGKYSLIYVRGVKGAAVGKHTVTIQATNKQGREQLPATCNTNTALRENVEPGNNTFDFNLKSTR